MEQPSPAAGFFHRFAAHGSKLRLCRKPIFLSSACRLLRQPPPLGYGARLRERSPSRLQSSYYRGLPLLPCHRRQGRSQDSQSFRRSLPAPRNFLRALPWRRLGSSGETAIGQHRQSHKAAVCRAGFRLRTVSPDRRSPHSPTGPSARGFPAGRSPFDIFGRLRRRRPACRNSCIEPRRGACREPLPPGIRAETLVRFLPRPSRGSVQLSREMSRLPCA